MEWKLNGAQKDEQSIVANKQEMIQELIEGVVVREIKNVPKHNGYLTEIYRKDFNLDNLGVDQIFQVTLLPKGISAWHAHEYTTDKIFVNQGLIRIVIYDGRVASPTYKKLNTFIFGTTRPALVIIPPKVWHGVQNISNEISSLINVVDEAYQYENPDHWRVPKDSPDIPFTF
jgi:dTDP-4-dehydrorhamnose 3,5-epimerase